MIVEEKDVEDELERFAKVMSSPNQEKSALHGIEEVVSDQLAAADILNGHPEMEARKLARQHSTALLKLVSPPDDSIGGGEAPDTPHDRPSLDDDNSLVPRFSTVAGIAARDDAEALRAQIALLEIQLEHERVKAKELANSHSHIVEHFVSKNQKKQEKNVR